MKSVCFLSTIWFQSGQYPKHDRFLESATPQLASQTIAAHYSGQASPTAAFLKKIFTAEGRVEVQLFLLHIITTLQ